MKKLITKLMMMSILSTVTLFGTVSTDAQTRYATRRARTATVYKRPNVYRRHRKAFNIGIGTGLGMLVGGLLGGGKGVVIGGLGGAGGGALFTHYQKPKNYVRYYRPYW